MLKTRTGRAMMCVLLPVVLTLGGCASAEDIAAIDNDTTASASDGSPSTDPTNEPANTENEPEPSIPVPEVRDCRQLNGDAVYAGFTDASAQTVNCSDRHNAQTVYVTTARGSQKKHLKSGDGDALFEAMLPECRKRLASWTGSDLGRLSRSMFGVVVGVPPAKDVELGATWIRCDVSLSGVDDRPIALPRKTRGVLSKERSDYDLCVRGKFSQRGTTILSCAHKHDSRSIASIPLGDTSKPYPGESDVIKRLKRRCTTEALNYRDPSSRYGYTYPTKPQWKLSTGFGTCYVQTKR